MNLFATAPSWLLGVLTALLVCAALQDAVQLKISNLISGGVLISALLAMAIAGPQLALWQNFAAFVAMLVIGTAMFSRGIFGGGDVKLFAAVVLWADGSTGLKLATAILVLGGLIALLIILLRTIAPERAKSAFRLLRPRTPIPYAVAIAAGTLFVLGAATPGTLHGPPDPRSNFRVG